MPLLTMQFTYICHIYNPAIERKEKKSTIEDCKYNASKYGNGDFWIGKYWHQMTIYTISNKKNL